MKNVVHYENCIRLPICQQDNYVIISRDWSNPFMNETRIKVSLSKFFVENLPHDFVLNGGAVEELLLREYGALFVARGGAVPPGRVIFESEEQVSEFQHSVPRSTKTIGGYELTLQTAAMEALISAIAIAQESGLDINPRGKDSAARSYADTVSLWASRVEPALDHWTKEGKITLAEADGIRNLSSFEQVPEIFELEKYGIYFAKDLSKSIIYSVAPPGTSQHLSMLALDVAEFNDKKVREILADHGWYQTVVSDLPHFTFLGIDQAELPGHGLKKIVNGERIFWVPEI